MRSLILGVLGLLLASPLRAEEPVEVGWARSFMDAGVHLFATGDFKGALAQFRAAEHFGETYGDLAGVRYNIARCLEELGEREAAIDAFERYLAVPDNVEDQTVARERLASLRGFFGDLAVSCEEPGVTVRLERGREGERPCPSRFVMVPVGQHTVTAYASDGARTRREVTVEPRAESTVSLVFIREASSEPPAPAQTETLQYILGVAGGLVLVGGTVFVMEARGSFRAAEEAMERHRVAATDADADAALDRARELRDEGRVERLAGYLMWGGGAALAGAAVWMLVGDGDSAPQKVTTTPGLPAFTLSGRW